MIVVDNWRNVAAVDWRWPHFTPLEMSCRRSMALTIDPEFMDRLEALRAAVGHPLRISSGYRSPAHNASVSKTGLDGPHTTGRAADILISGAAVYALVREAMAFGFTGIGVDQKGPHAARIIHVDDLPLGEIRPRMWSYD